MSAPRVSAREAPERTTQKNRHRAWTRAPSRCSSTPRTWSPGTTGSAWSGSSRRPPPSRLGTERAEAHRDAGCVPAECAGPTVLAARGGAHLVRSVPYAVDLPRRALPSAASARPAPPSAAAAASARPAPVPSLVPGASPAFSRAGPPHSSARRTRAGCSPRYGRSTRPSTRRRAATARSPRSCACTPRSSRCAWTRTARRGCAARTPRPPPPRTPRPPPRTRGPPRRAPPPPTWPPPPRARLALAAGGPGAARARLRGPGRHAGAEPRATWLGVARPTCGDDTAGRRARALLMHAKVVHYVDVTAGVTRFAVVPGLDAAA